MFNPMNRKKGPRKKPSYYPFRSLLEKRIALALGDNYVYEPKKGVLSYSIPKKYTPDFVPNNCKEIVLEVKGYFRDSAEASKYVHIKEDNPHIEIIFIFINAKKLAYAGCSKRRDGTRQTQGEWADRNGFLYYEEKHLPQEILEGTITLKWIAEEKKKRGLS